MKRKKHMKKIVFTGGGTVGHVTLNLLLIPKFIEDGWEVHYIGDKNGIEHDQLIQSGLAVKFHHIATGKLRRYFSWENIRDMFKVAWGLLQSLFILAKLRPQLLFSKGGFVSVPPVVAAKLLRRPVFIHESDLSIGLANKIAYKFATTMYTTFEQPPGLAKAKHVGAVTKMGTAASFDDTRLAEIRAAFDSALPTVLFVGGSGGAKVFNDFISQHQVWLTQRFNIINLSGDSRLNTLRPNLCRIDYATDLYQPLLDLADLAVTRGGSNTLFELLALQKLHVIVPLSKKASRGDQLENAAYFEKKGYAPMLKEEDLSPENLEHSIKQLLSQKEHYQTNMAASQEIRSADDFYCLLNEDIAKVSKT